MRWRRAWRGEGGAAVSAGCGKVKEAGRKDQRGGEWNSTDEVRYARSNGIGEMISSSLAQVRVRVRVRERMGGGLGENERVREWV